MNASFPGMETFGRRAAEFFGTVHSPRGAARAPQRAARGDTAAPPPPPAATGGGGSHSVRNPPASKRAIRQLPTVVVAPEDLVDPSNRECCICLEENHLREHVIRLPCAHIFHSHCILDWLRKSNTCPVCRYELLTDDPLYERNVRMERMKHRKPRYADYELKRMAIRDLTSLSERLHVSVTGCMEKSELVTSLLQSGKVDVIVAPPAVEYPLSLLRAMGIGELKRCMADAGVFFDPRDVVEKEDMVQIFVGSGRLIVTVEEEEGVVVNDIAMNEMPTDEDGDSKMPARTTSESSAPSVATTRQSSNESIASRKRPPPSDDDDDDDDCNSRVPVVTTVFEGDSDGEDEDHVGTPHRHDSLPQTNPLMEEVDLDENVAFESLPDVGVESNQSSRSPADEAREPEIRQSGAAPPCEDGIEQATGSATDNEIEEDVSMEEGDEYEAQDVDTSYPVLVGRHASTGTDDVSLVDEYASTSSAADGSQFHERSISDLQALARLMRVDITDCIERSEIIGRLVTATGRSDPRLVPNDFVSWSVSELRALAREVNVDLSNCADRLTMIAMLIEAANERPRVADYLSALMPLARLTVPQLRAIGREWQVDLHGCLEKEEMIHRLVIAGGPAS